jgi:hypothetical protein
MSVHSRATLDGRKVTPGCLDGWLSDLGSVREGFPHDKLGISFDIDIATIMKRP